MGRLSLLFCAGILAPFLYEAGDKLGVWRLGERMYLWLKMYWDKLKKVIEQCARGGRDCCNRENGEGTHAPGCRGTTK